MKRFLLIFLLAFVCFFGIDKIYASSQVLNPDMYIDSLTSYYNIGSDKPIYSFNQSADIYVYTDNTLSLQAQGAVRFSNAQVIQPNYFHVRWSICTEKGVTGGWSVDGDNVRDVNFVNTEIKCSFSKGGTGKVSIGTYRLIPFVYEDVIYINRTVATTVYSPSRVQYLGVEFGLQPFPEVYPEDTIIKQNQQIIGILGSQNNNDVVSAINESNKKLDESNKLAKDKLEQDKKQHEDIMNDDTSGANSEAESFFSGFSTDTHGLTGIITAPITLIGNITSSSCTPLQVPLPFVNNNLALPCMSSIYSEYFGSFYDIYKIITFGIVAYWVCVRIFNLVKDFKNPEHDEIEVMDL